MRWIVAGLIGGVLFAGVALADDAPAPDGNTTPESTAAAPAVTPTPPAPVAPSPVVVKGPVARMQTSLGTMVIALDREHAPLSVANFVRYAKEKHFDGTVIYRVETGVLIQGGSWGTDYKFKGGLHAAIPLESSNGLSNTRGAIAMAHGDKPASATAEFFLDVIDLPSLNADPKAKPNTTGFAVFGYVIEGLDVLDRIGALKNGGSEGPFPKKSPVTKVVIEKVTISDH